MTMGLFPLVICTPGRQYHPPVRLCGPVSVTSELRDYLVLRDDVVISNLIVTEEFHHSLARVGFRAQPKSVMPTRDLSRVCL